jgi:hypothetical protein
MSPIYTYNGKILTERGKVAINQACCCGEGGGEEGCCCINGTSNAAYTTKEDCEACTTVFSCFDEESFELVPVEDCSECEGFCSESEEGPCGDWLENHDCLNQDIDCSQVDEVSFSGLPERAQGSGPNSVDGGDKFLLNPSTGQMFRQFNNASFSASSFDFVFTLSQQCGKWYLSMSAVTTNQDFWVNWTFNAYGPTVTDNSCSPFGSYTGILYWDGGVSSGSESVAITIGA